jgi:two-component system sensor histidine kinase/response regulator
MKVLVDAEAKGRPYDVAILDGELADTNTLELGKAIKASKDIGSTVLLILLPLNNEFEPLALRAAGFAGHLVKPVRQSRLYDTIVDAIALASQPEKLVAPNPSAAIDSSSRSAAAMQQARILIVEDNRVNQIVATEVLAVYGYASDIAENGKKAVTAAATGKYDLILMDCLMPEMDGFEATSRIRQAEATDAKNPHRHTPIIALTANAINGDRTRCLEVGMDDYVSKPIDAKRLVDAIQTLLAKSAETSPVPSALAAPAPTTASEDTPPLAIEALLERCMGSIETATSILDEFERQAVADLGEIKRHVLSGDCEATARVAHALKGASGILSADALAGIALKLEKMGRSGVISDQDQLLSQLNREVRRCIDYLPIARSAITKKVEV